MKKTVITIARSYGSGGRTLGKLLAEQLGINCYDREILRMASDAAASTRHCSDRQTSG